MKLYEIVSSRRAKEDCFYIYEGVVYAYSKIKTLKHEDRFRRVCSSENYKDKLENDLNNGFHIEIIKQKNKR